MTAWAGRDAVAAGFGDLLVFFVNGIVLASILALAAIGLTLVYGILRLSNFAHGDLLTVGAYVVFGANVAWAPRTATLAAFVMAGLLGGVVIADRFAWKRLHRRERMGLAAVVAVLLLVASVPSLGAATFGDRFLLGTVLSLVAVPFLLLAMDRLIWSRLRRQGANAVTLIITSIGIALVLRQVLALEFGTRLQAYARPSVPPWRFGDVIVTPVQVATIVIAVVVVTGIHLFLQRTRTGRSLRAMSDNIELARVTGIDVPRMIAYVWILAGALAALAGILLAMNVNVNTNLGWNLILPIFASVILGGIGSPYGALLGALIIGVAMELSVAWVPQYRLAVGFLILIAAMLVRPQGLLGVKR